jgi:nitrogen regulatory protein P-II 1
MKRIEAYIKPEKLEDVKEALKTIDLKGMSISQIMGCGTQMGWKEIVKGPDVEFNFRLKIKLEMFASDELADEIVDIIRDVTHTGDIGDGKIFISEVLDAIRIRTGERGLAAIV